MRFGGDWTEKKLEILERYLRAYLVALKKQPFDLMYIDGFAGAGYREISKGSQPEGSLIGEELDEAATRFVAGAAIRALMLDPPFDRCHFIERSQKNAAALRKHIEGLGSAIPYEISTADANQVIQHLCSNWPRQRRAVMFLDPFGMQVEWGTLERIAATRAIDVWLLFPIGSVLRLMKTDGDLPKTWSERLDISLGTITWRTALYTKTEATDLFGDLEETVERETADKVLGYFNERLKTIFPAVAPNPRVLRNRNNAPLFAFCFAASNGAGAPIALRIANHILGKL